MRTIEIVAVAEARTARGVFPIISDFERYQEQCQAVRRVIITEKTQDRSVSKWEVNFRQGIMRWTEVDVFDDEKFSIHFEQIEGDAKHFSGAWLLSDSNAGCEIRFIASFDMGVPSISDIIEPIAERALEENVESILRGLLGGQVEIVSRPCSLSRPS
jgi:ribosome-associated toxin RatA of RatAB toxin-antitoxin module